MKSKKISIVIIIICIITTNFLIFISINTLNTGLLVDKSKDSRNEELKSSAILSGKKICVDPGHGGTESGTTGIDGSGYPDEKHINLDISLHLRDLLIYAGATVIMTRTSDTTVSLASRCSIANSNSADIFVSVHNNANSNSAAKGTETLYWGESSSVYSVNGRRLADGIQKGLILEMGRIDRGIKMDYPYLTYHLYVLSNTDMPAALPECVFMSNQDDFNYISIANNRYKAAVGIYRGICSYFGVTPVFPSDPSDGIEDKRICIDPGNGGTDMGVLGIDGPAFPNEEDFNLDVGLRLKEMLLYAGGTVIMTRDSDITVSIDQRCATANNNDADIFVSFQCNNLDSSTATRGSETYYWAESDVSYSVNGLNLASSIQTRIVSDLGTTNRGAKGDYPTLDRHFDELSNTNMPSVMVYPVFLSNQEDYNLISNPNLRSKIALAIFKGICDYFNEDLDIIPSTSDVIISGYTTPTSSVSRTLYFGQCISNAQLITRASWYLDGEHVEDLCFKEWFVNSDTISELNINTFDYNIGTHSIRIETTDLWDLENTYEQELAFYRTPIIDSKVHGSSDTGKMVDDDDTTYASNDLGSSLYIELPCNYDIWAIKIHFWDGDNRYYQYKIETSTDNTTWTLAVDKTSGEHKSWQWDVINSKVRFIKITGTYNSQNQWWHVKEVQLFARTSPAFYVYGDVQGGDNITFTDLTNGQSMMIEVIEEWYEFDLSTLNFNYGDTIQIIFQDITETFIVIDPQTSKKIDLIINSDSSEPENPDIPIDYIQYLIYILIIVGLSVVILTLGIAYTKKKSSKDVSSKLKENKIYRKDNSTSRLISSLNTQKNQQTNIYQNTEKITENIKNNDYSSLNVSNQNPANNYLNIYSGLNQNLQCPRCNAKGRDIKLIVDKNQVISYYPKKVYESKRVCTKCKFEY
ncbi:MAG: N-acetylmuramoyl-L-alanine amidase [Promethearchaeota archaeon]